MANTANKKLVMILIALGVMFLMGVIVLACLGAGWFYYRNTTSAPPQVTQVTAMVTPPVLPTSTQGAAPPAAPTAAPLPTQPPVPTALAPTAAPTPNVVYGNISLMLDPDIAASAAPETVPASPPVPDGPYWDVYPQHTQINLNGYLLSGAFHNPRISIYPLQAYEAMGDPVHEVMDATRQLLRDRPTQVESIRTLPVWNAGQVFHARLHYLDFKNGSGVAFLTEYAQYFAPINNHDLFYNFQGITSDGQYYVVAILPVGHPNLIPDANISPEEFQKLADDYQGYLNEMIPMLESQSPNSFTPSLDKLDAMLQSIEIQ